MVNFFSSSPCSISGGGCACSGAENSISIEPFTEMYDEYDYEHPQSYTEYEGYSNTASGVSANSQTVSTAQEQGILDPIGSYFSQFFESPIKQTQVQPFHQQQTHTPFLQEIAQGLGLSPAMIQSLVTQVSQQFNINPSELKENVLHFLSQFGINPGHIRPLINEVAARVGLNNKMGRSGIINPHAIKQVLEKSNIPVTTNQTASPSNSAQNTRSKVNQVSNLSQQPQVHHNRQQQHHQQQQHRKERIQQLQQQLAQLQQQGKVPEFDKAAVLARLQETHPQMYERVQHRLVKPVVVEIPVVHSSNGSKEPVVVKNNGKITTPSGKNVAVDSSGVLKNTHNGTPVTVSNQVVAVNSAKQLVNSKTGNPVTVIANQGAVNPVALSQNQARMNNQKVNGFTNVAAPSANGSTSIISPNYSEIDQPETEASQNPTFNRNAFRTYFPSIDNQTYDTIAQTLKNRRQPPINISTINPENLSYKIDEFLQQYSDN
jgi:hypothetical protein